MWYDVECGMSVVWKCEMWEAAEYESLRSKLLCPVPCPSVSFSDGGSYVTVDVTNKDTTKPSQSSTSQKGRCVFLKSRKI